MMGNKGHDKIRQEETKQTKESLMYDANRSFFKDTGTVIIGQGKGQEDTRQTKDNGYEIDRP